MPVCLRVHGLEGVFVQRLLMPLSGLATTSYTLGIIAMIFSALGMGVIADGTAWQMIMIGLATRVLLRVAGAGMGR